MSTASPYRGLFARLFALFVLVSFATAIGETAWHCHEGRVDVRDHADTSDCALCDGLPAAILTPVLVPPTAVYAGLLPNHCESPISIATAPRQDVRGRAPPTRASS